MPLEYTIEYVRRLLHEVQQLKKDFGVTTDQTIFAMIAGAILADLKIKYERAFWANTMKPDKW